MSAPANCCTFPTTKSASGLTVVAIGTGVFVRLKASTMLSFTLTSRKLTAGALVPLASGNGVAAEKMFIWYPLNAVLEVYRSEKVPLASTEVNARPTSGSSAGGGGGDATPPMHVGTIMSLTAAAPVSEKMTFCVHTCKPLNNGVCAVSTVTVTNSVKEEEVGRMDPLRLKPITVLEGPAWAVMEGKAEAASAKGIAVLGLAALCTSNW